MRRLVLLALLALAACARSDFDKICNAEQLSGADQVDPSQRATYMARWVVDHIHSSEAKQTLKALDTVPDMKARRDLLRRAASEAGYNGPCPMADDPPPR